jgi:cytochrome c556
MRGTARGLAILSVCVLAFSPGVIPAQQHKHDHSKLPPGPIRDRHELMEAQGQQAENINNAFAMGSEGFDVGIIQRAAQAIALSSAQIPGLFPKGSTDPHSRALPAIWDNWDKFVQLSKQLEDQATSLSNAAGSGQDEKLQDKAKKMFATCKSCHDQFRRPEEKKKKGS